MNLKELIEACGDDFYSLVKERKIKNTKWRAFSSLYYEDNTGWFNTPEEAVTALLLKLKEYAKRNKTSGKDKMETAR